MKRQALLLLALAASGCSNHDQPPAGSLSVTLDAGGVGAVVVRVVGPRPFTITAVSSSVYLQGDTVNDALNVALFGDRLAGTVATLKMLDGASEGSYSVTVLQAADTGNGVLDPAAVHVRLVAGSQ